jgi:hypothetical protein
MTIKQCRAELAYIFAGALWKQKENKEAGADAVSRAYDMGRVDALKQALEVLENGCKGAEVRKGADNDAGL